MVRVVANVAEAGALATRLQHPRYEVLPLEGIDDEVRAHVPRTVTITVTASPRQGLEATVAVATRLALDGYRVVPHLSARLVRDEAHLDEVVGQLLAAGVRDLFVPAGDAPMPSGEFQGAADLLRAMGDRRRRFATIGITGYPESHHLISDELTIQAMFAKADMATDIISQVCFDPDVIAAWVHAVRERGTRLPIWIGVPGSVDYARLVRISMRIGLGESTRFLRAHRDWMRRLITRRFDPGPIVRRLTPLMADPGAAIAGLHVYTFNDLERTERWRRQTLARLGATR